MIQGVKMNNLDAAVLNSFPAVDESMLDDLLGKEIKANNMKIVVLDDDPTGVQTVHDVSVYTDWSVESIREGFAEDKAVQQKVVQYFSSFDENIKGFTVEEVPAEGDSKESTFKINSLHKKIDSDEVAEIPLGMESAGTLKMFALYPELQEVLQKGSVYFIDELNARLHPLLVRNFILIFLNPEVNVNHAQLIFTTHDTWQLSNQLLRRDEIWFTEKDSDGVSTLYSLADFVDEDGSKIRKDESYEKNYLLGKYGAIPTLKTIDLLKED